MTQRRETETIIENKKKREKSMIQNRINQIEGLNKNNFVVFMIIMINI